MKLEKKRTNELLKIQKLSILSGHYIRAYVPFLRPLRLSFWLVHNNQFHKILLLGLGTNLFLLLTSKSSSDCGCVVM